MNKKMKKFIQVLKSIKLSEKEKDVLRHKIEEFISFNPIRHELHIPKKSFYFSIFTFRALGKAVALVLIAIIVVGGSGVSYASTDSLPGDKLYNVKINVNEKIEEKLAFSTEAKVVVQTQKVERRLTEAQKLVEKEDFSPEKKEIVKANLEKNVHEVTESIENLKNEGKIEAALDTTSKITPVLEAHRKVLTEQKIEAESKTEVANDANVAMFAKMSVATESTDPLLDTVEAAIKKVEEAEKEIIEEANEDQKTAEEVTEKNTKEVTEKIETLKKEGVDVETSAKTEIEQDVTLTPTESGDATSDIATVTETSSTIMNMQMSAPASLTAMIISETDAELRVKDAQSLLLQAENAKKSGNFKEALILSQQAKKIIAQIEEYQKIKHASEVSVETTQKTDTTKTEPSTESSTQTTTDAKTEVKIDVPLIDIKAEAIKSLEETNASLQKINFNQSTQSRLLP